MARKRKSSPLEDMLDLVSLLPWWAGDAISVSR
jgi:restriction system protein